ncbi:thymidine kinase [bacterium]|nr:thymidine kinase [bacterium]
MGRLEVITGCMFAGKTEELLRRLERAKIAQKKVLLFKPEIDNRYSTTDVVTHYGRKFPCSLLPLKLTKKYILSHFGEEILAADVVAFDEAHFFKGNFVRICQWLVAEGKRVIVAGLDLDFRGKPFGYMPQLLALADEVVKLQAVCVVCGKPATRSQRIINGKPASRKSPLELIGGLETYEPRCVRCYVPPR